MRFLSQNNSTCVRSLMPEALPRLRILVREANAVSWRQTVRGHAPSSLSTGRALVRCRRWAEPSDGRTPRSAFPRGGRAFGRADARRYGRCPARNRRRATLALFLWRCEAENASGLAAALRASSETIEPALDPHRK